MNRWILIAAAFLLVTFVWVLSSMAKPHPDDVDGQVKAIANSLRCPQCEWLSAWQSNSESAIRMREEIRDMVLAGMTREQIIASYVDRYGDSILLMPPMRGTSVLAYVFPLAVLIGGTLWLRRHLAKSVERS